MNGSVVAFEIECMLEQHRETHIDWVSMEYVHVHDLCAMHASHTVRSV